MSRTRDRITVGKAHAFDMGYTADELKTAWDTVKKTNVLVQHLENNGVTPLQGRRSIWQRRGAWHRNMNVLYRAELRENERRKI